MTESDHTPELIDALKHQKEIFQMPIASPEDIIGRDNLLAVINARVLVLQRKNVTDTTPDQAATTSSPNSLTADIPLSDVLEQQRAAYASGDQAAIEVANAGITAAIETHKQVTAQENPDNT